MGLTSWDQPTDNYNYAQLAGNWQIVDFHDHSPGRGVQIPAGGLGAGSVVSSNIANGQVGLQHLAPLVVQDLGLTSGGFSGRAKINIALADTQAGAGFAVMPTTADQVSVTLNTDGLLFIAYQALWKASTGTAQAGIFLNGVALTAGAANAVPSVTAAQTSSANAFYQPLYTQSGLQGLTALSSTTTDSTEVTTGEIVAGATVVYAAAATYTVSIRFIQSVAKARHLWVWAVNF